MRHPMQGAQKVPWLLFPLLQAEIYCWQVWGIHRKKKVKLILDIFFNSASWHEGKSKQKSTLNDLKSMFTLPQAHSLAEFSCSFALPSTKLKFPPPLNLHPSSSPEAPLLISRSLLCPRVNSAQQNLFYKEQKKQIVNYFAFIVNNLSL